MKDHVAEAAIITVYYLISNVPCQNMSKKPMKPGLANSGCCGWWCYILRLFVHPSGLCGDMISQECLEGISLGLTQTFD